MDRTFRKALAYRTRPHATPRAGHRAGESARWLMGGWGSCVPTCGLSTVGAHRTCKVQR